MRIEVEDKQGVKTLKYDEAAKYHGGFHMAGVALGWKFLEAALARLDGPLRRDAAYLTLGATPPGVTDCLEYATRALSRRRAVVDRNFMNGPKTCCGTLSFALASGGKRLTAALRPDILPRAFADTATRIDAGVAGETETAQWQAKSRELAAQFLGRDSADLFDVTQDDCRRTASGAGATGRRADYTVSEQSPLKVRDDAGECAIGLDEMLRFHDMEHYAGVVLAYKVFSLAFKELWDDAVPHRKDITILSGLNPPGLIDSFEYVARAITRQRHCLIADNNGSPDSPFGKFVFRVCNGERQCNLKLRPGLLPEDFASIGRKAEAGLADESEQTRWEAYKHDVGKELAGMAPGDILEIV
ncbi:hypothetical protein [Pseudodesulfovibrio sp.]|uniref:hypothetical protein n=1 Tax=Pseudodesulfovibrio sp. TaxID=2035812 RepID=UPI002614957C|nr:hypothetical protein [Pseudodesulfovibrio sp.]MDD3313851.1 hypothetical protein [Pseudodesulfovibrio sp.]